MNTRRGLTAGFIVALLVTVWRSNVDPLSFALGDKQTEKPRHTGPGCGAVDHFFAEEVWAKIGERTCLKCHNADGDASESKFLLQDTTRHRNADAGNQAAFVRMATAKEKDKSRLLVKVTGGLDHGGGQVLKPDLSAYRILERFVRRTVDPKFAAAQLAAAIKRADSYNSPPFFDGVRMVTPPRLLRRVTLSLAARLPTKQEQATVSKRGLDAIDEILDGVMQEEAFYERLKEGFNDVFLTVGYGGNETVLSYDHFNKTRLWYQKHDLSKIPEKDRRKARYKLADDYREALRREPMELIEHIVRNDHPFTELVTADYIMVSPYSSRGYGVFEAVKDQFKNVDDPFEYVPTKLKALKSRNGKVQESATGFYPRNC